MAGSRSSARERLTPEGSQRTKEFGDGESGVAGRRGEAFVENPLAAPEPRQRIPLGAVRTPSLDSVTDDEDLGKLDMDMGSIARALQPTATDAPVSVAAAGSLGLSDYALKSITNAAARAVVEKLHIKGLRARENFHIDDEQLDMFLVQFDLKRADKLSDPTIWTRCDYLLFRCQLEKTFTEATKDKTQLMETWTVEELIFHVRLNSAPEYRVHVMGTEGRFLILVDILGVVCMPVDYLLDVYLLYVWYSIGLYGFANTGVCMLLFMMFCQNRVESMAVNADTLPNKALHLVMSILQVQAVSELIFAWKRIRGLAVAEHEKHPADGFTIAKVDYTALRSPLDDLLTTGYGVESLLQLILQAAVVVLLGTNYAQHEGLLEGYHGLPRFACHNKTAGLVQNVSVPLGLGLEGTVPPQFLCSGDGRFACVDRSDELVCGGGNTFDSLTQIVKIDIDINSYVPMISLYSAYFFGTYAVCEPYLRWRDRPVSSALLVLSTALQTITNIAMYAEGIAFLVRPEYDLLVLTDQPNCSSAFPSTALGQWDQSDYNNPMSPVTPENYVAGARWMAGAFLAIFLLNVASMPVLVLAGVYGRGAKPNAGALIGKEDSTVLNYVVMIIINMIVATDCNLRLEPRSFGAMSVALLHYTELLVFYFVYFWLLGVSSPNWYFGLPPYALVQVVMGALPIFIITMSNVIPVHVMRRLNDSWVSLGVAAYFLFFVYVVPIILYVFLDGRVAMQGVAPIPM